VDLSDDLPPARRPLFFPVVIATVFLSIIGMSAGLVLGARQKREDRQVQQQQQQQQQQQEEEPAPVGQPGTGSDPGDTCRPETYKMARQAGATGTLRIRLQLRTTSSTVWICEDDAGRLYYHANRGGDRWVENETALFLPDVRRDGSDEAFVVTATDGTNFSITPKRLFIVHQDGREEIQPAVR
jgi:hypothetical protein